MTKRYLVIVITISVLLFVSAGQLMAGDIIGEFGGSVGGVFPQGDFVLYSDPGPGFNLRLNSHAEFFQGFSLRLEAGGSLFKSESEPILLDYGGSFLLSGEETISETAWTIHAGLQLGSDSRRSFFRPRVSLSPGLYFFANTTSYDFPADEFDFVEDIDLQVKFGWRSVIGVDLFFTTAWGLSFDFMYDQVYSLHHRVVKDIYGEVHQLSRDARFHGYMIGIVIPMEHSK